MHKLHTINKLLFKTGTHKKKKIYDRFSFKIILIIQMASKNIFDILVLKF